MLQDLHAFFRDQRIVSVRIPKDDGRMKGYALVDFETREDLIDALAKDEEMLKNRAIRINLADANKDGPGGDIPAGGEGGL